MNWNDKLIRLFVFGTLRKGDRLDYYMDGSEFAGLYYTQGQLMKSEIGSAYIEFEDKNAATLGELHYVNYPSLLRIDHLETRSGEFPKGYDLDLIPVWKYEKEKGYVFDESSKSFAFFYRRRNSPVKVVSGDWVTQTKPIEEIKNFLMLNENNISVREKLISHMNNYLGYNFK